MSLPSTSARAGLALLPLLLVSCMALHEELPPGVEGAPSPDVHTASRAEVATAIASGAETPASSAALAIDVDVADDATWTQLRSAALSSVAPEAAAGWPADEALAAQIEATLVAATDTFAAPDSASLGELMTARLELPAGDVPGGGVTRVRPADVTGDGEEDLLVAVPAAGVPAFALVRDGEGWSAHRLPSTATAGYPQLAEVADADGDGTMDVVYTTYVELPEHTVTTLRVARWSDGAFEELLAAPQDDWHGPAASNELWSVDTADGQLVVRSQCGAVGAFDDRFLDHPVATRTYAWDPATERLALVAREVAAPESARQAANVGEAALRAGDLEAAEAMYEQVANGDFPLRDATDVDWTALARFRLAQVYGGIL